MSAIATPCDTLHSPDRPAQLAQTADIVTSYDALVTLRQLFYRLAAAQLLPNTTNAYKSLSKYTAEARRAGTFPALTARGRTIHRDMSFTNPPSPRRWLRRIYRRDRIEGQSCALGLGVPVLALGGYCSQTYVADVVSDVEATGRPAVLLYAGDHDPNGEDIDPDFTAANRLLVCGTTRRSDDRPGRADALPPQAGKKRDSRARRFVERQGRLVQVEIDALAPEVLRDLYAAAMAEFWNDDVHKQALGA